jgi:hypothetical protein
VDKNENLLRRLEQFHSSHFENASIRFFDDGESTFQRREPPAHIPGSSNNIRALESSKKSSEGSAGEVISPRDFETVLEKTRVYARVQSNDCDISFTSSAIRNTAWSMLSGLSLNDISVISVLALPLSLEEVESIGSQLTFASILSRAQEPALLNSHNSQLFSSSVEHETLLRPTARGPVERRRRMLTQDEKTPFAPMFPTIPNRGPLRKRLSDLAATVVRASTPYQYCPFFS